MAYQLSKNNFLNNLIVFNGDKLTNITTYYMICFDGIRKTGPGDLIYIIICGDQTHRRSHIKCGRNVFQIILVVFAGMYLPIPASCPEDQVTTLARSSFNRVLILQLRLIVKLIVVMP